MPSRCVSHTVKKMLILAQAQAPPRRRLSPLSSSSKLQSTPSHVPHILFANPPGAPHANPEQSKHRCRSVTYRTGTPPYPLRLAKHVKKHTITVAYLEGWRCKTATLTPSSTASASVRKYARGTRKLPLTSCSQSLCTFSVHAKNIHGVVGGRSTQTSMLHHSEHHVVRKSYVTYTAQAIVTADVSQTNSQHRSHVIK